MKWFSLSLALVCLLALQVAIQAKPVDEEEEAAASTSADETPAETADETPTEETPTEETPAESSKESSSSESSESSGKVISAPVSTKKPWTIEGIRNDAQMIFETIKDGIETADKALEFYDKLVDRVIPWDEFNKTLVELDAFRKEYSVESAALIGDTKTLMMNGMDEYFSASQNVYEWAATVDPLLKIYIKLFDKLNEEKAQTQRTLLLKVLDEGIKKMTDARKDLEKCSRSFNDAGGKLEALTIRFDAEFNEKSEFVQSQILRTKIIAYSGGAIFGIPGLLVAHYCAVGQFVPKLMEKLKSIEDFYTELKGKVQTGGKQIEEIKTMLKKEVQHISDLKGQVEETKSYVNVDEIPEMRDEVIASVKKLMNHCTEYRKRHNSKTDLV